MHENAIQEEGLAYVSRAEKKARRRRVIPQNTTAKQWWAVAAAQAVEAFEAAGYGKRGALVRSLATDLEMSPTYLRQAIAAYKFAVSGVIPSVALSTFPIAVVGHLKRWSESNLADATEAAEAFAREDLDADEVAERARDAQDTHPTEQPAYRTAAALRSHVKDVALDHFGDFELTETEEKLAENHITLRKRDGSEHAAVVVTGPFGDPDLERQRCREALLQALGLLMSHEHVALACASNEAAELARDLLAEMRRAKGLAFRNTKFDDRISVWGFGIPARALTETQMGAENPQKGEPNAQKQDAVTDADGPAANGRVDERHDIATIDANEVSGRNRRRGEIHVRTAFTPHVATRLRQSKSKANVKTKKRAG